MHPPLPPTHSLLHGNRLTGGLPPTWGDDMSFRVLDTLTLAGNPLGGTLPPEWGAYSWSLPLLTNLNVSSTGLDGTVPPHWDAGLLMLRTL